MPFEDWNILCWHWMFKIFMPLARWPTKQCTVQCALLGVSSVCWKSWTDAIICRNLATQLSGRLLKITNQITQKPGNKNLVPVKVRANTHRMRTQRTEGTAPKQWAGVIGWENVCPAPTLNWERPEITCSNALVSTILSPACTPSGIIGWFSNRTGTSVDDGARKSNNWLDQWQSGKSDTESRV